MPSRHINFTGGEIWLIRIFIAFLMVIFVPSWLSNLSINDFLIRLVVLLIFCAVAFGEWMKKLATWLIKLFANNSRRRY